MRMYNRFRAAALAALIPMLCAPACAQSSAAERASETAAGGDGVFASATAAYRQGISAFRSGAVKAGLPALKFAADRGVLGAQLRLAELYATGRDVPRDDGKAYAYYRQVADSFAEITPRSPVAKYVAASFVALGRYQLSGIPDIGLSPNPRRAAELFSHAASYFGYADAQYELARLYLAGSGVPKNMRVGANWLAMAARKQHPAAQATLGEMMVRDRQPRQRYVRGLALIALARYNAEAAGGVPSWIDSIYATAFADADDAARLEAEAVVPRWGGPQIAIARKTPPAVAAETHMPGLSGGTLIFSDESGMAAFDAEHSLDVVTETLAVQPVDEGGTLAATTADPLTGDVLVDAESLPATGASLGSASAQNTQVGSGNIGGGSGGMGGPGGLGMSFGFGGEGAGFAPR